MYGMLHIDAKLLIPVEELTEPLAKCTAYSFRHVSICLIMLNICTVAIAGL